MKKSVIAFFAACLLFAQSADALPRLGIFGAQRKPDITVESFKWKSGGTGRRAVFSSVTLKNNGETDYSAIVLKARFFSRDARPSGAVRGKLDAVLKAGEERTFENVRLGIMNLDMSSVSLEVAGAVAVSDRKPKHPLAVTGWDWRPGGYGGGAGTVSSVTVSNPSQTPFGKVEFLIVQKKAGEKISSHSVKMNKIAEANTETVYENVNPGFVHPDTDGIEVTVRSARPVSQKQAVLMKGGLPEKNGPESPEAGESAVPGYDIEVRGFEWEGGVAGSLGKIKSLVLKNRSSIRYKEVHLAAEFLAKDGRTVLTSNRFKIKNPPAPGNTRIFENLTVGILSVSPDRNLVRVYVRGGKPERPEK